MPVHVGRRTVVVQTSIYRSDGKVAAMQLYAQQAKDRTMIEIATDIRYRAEIRAGELLREMMGTGSRDPGGRGPRVGSQAATQLPTFADIGVTKTQSSRWQALAALPVEAQEQKIAAAKKKEFAALDGTLKVERAEKRAEDAQRIRSLEPIKGKFRALIVDPPWDYGQLSIAGRAAPRYATMTHGHRC